MNEVEQLELEFTVSRVMQLSAVIFEHLGDRAVTQPAVFELCDLIDDMTTEMTMDVMTLLACQAQGLKVLEPEGDDA